uniref:Uncharacterized protein n=1 Tax=viral metagenome TaxID=1070528 RepID=A0A6C0DQ26_9ZZZZ
MNDVLCIFLFVGVVSVYLWLVVKLSPDTFDNIHAKIEL